MDKKETQSLADAYSKVPNESVVIREASWIQPHNRFKSYAKRTLAGRGDSPGWTGAGIGAAGGALLGPGGAALGALGGAAVGKLASWMTPEEWHGSSELEDETNEVWSQFRRQVLGRNPKPKGSEILGWFKNTLGIDPQFVPHLTDSLKPNKRYYDHDELRSIFREALRQAQQYATTGTHDYSSVFATDPGMLLKIILDMNIPRTVDLVRYLHQRRHGEKLGPIPGLASYEVPGETAEDRAKRNEERNLDIFDSAEGMEAGADLVRQKSDENGLELGCLDFGGRGMDREEDAWVQKLCDDEPDAGDGPTYEEDPPEGGEPGETSEEEPATDPAAELAEIEVKLRDPSLLTTDEIEALMQRRRELKDEIAAAPVEGEIISQEADDWALGRHLPESESPGEHWVNTVLPLIGMSDDEFNNHTREDQNRLVQAAYEKHKEEGSESDSELPSKREDIPPPTEDELPPWEREDDLPPPPSERTAPSPDEFINTIKGLEIDSIQTLVGDLDLNKIAIALVHSSPETADHLTYGLNKKDQREVMADVESKRADVKPAESQVAQNEILDKLDQMIEAGDIVIEPEEKESDEAS
jgi:hypothetical protein